MTIGDAEPRVLSPWCWHWHRPPGWQWCQQMQSQASTSHCPPGVNIETWEELSQTTSWERNLIVGCGEGLYKHSKEPFMRNHALWFLDQTLYGKGFVESPERKYLNEQQVSGWTVTKKGTWTVRTERYLLNERRMFRIKPLLTFH